MAKQLTFQINQQIQTSDCAPGSSLLSVLRDLGWVGVHRACDSGDCGSCTVWLDGQPVHSCIYPVHKVKNQAIMTIEGLAQDGKLHPMQQAFLQEQGFQCGYCTPGMIMSAAKLECNSEAEISSALKGNLCRCTGYQAILASCLKQQNSSQSQDELNPKCSVGQDVPKQDGMEIVTGQPVYTADWAPPGLLHLKVLRSPHAHARIRQIRTDQARSLPGVHLVLTHEDVPRVPLTTACHAEQLGDIFDHYILDNKVRFVGDRVAAVVAETPAIAAHACELIEVEYDILPHVLDPIAALKGEVVIHDEPESSRIHDVAHNVAAEVNFEVGDLERGFAEADLIVQTVYQLPAVQHVHLEPHVSTSWLDEDGKLVVRSSTQVPFHCQRMLSTLFGIPLDRIRVFKAKIGGGFGNKEELLSEDLCALATLRTGRPVQWEFSRTEEFTATNSRHAMTIRLKTGMKADGTLTAQDMEAIANAGAYGNHSGAVIYICGHFALGLYRCPNQRYHSKAVYTNTMPAGAFRGFGSTQGTFAVESQINELVTQLKLDPTEVWLKNTICPDDAIRIGFDENQFYLFGSDGVKQCFTAVHQAFAQSSDRPPNAATHLKRGVGFAVALQGSSLTQIHTAGAKLALTPNGRYRLAVGAVDLGTGSETSLRQIAAEVLQTTVSEIDLLAGDTARSPFDSGAYASSTIYISGKAVYLAAQKLRSHLLHLAMKALEVECQPLQLADLSLTGSEIGTEAQRFSLKALAHFAEQFQYSLEVETAYAADQSSMTFAVQGVEVEVDIETGQVKVLRCVQAIDIGKAINPRICHGQATGGIVMALGYALTEELQRDQNGVLLNPSLRTYRIPTAAEMPIMEVLFVENGDSHGPFGAKGVGEITTNCTAPAIANAIANATGVRLTQLPMTPERVWSALQKQPVQDNA
jgi:putative selenate reductase molybdopterin-binding subunit